MKVSGRSEYAQEMKSRVSPRKGHPRLPKGSGVLYFDDLMFLFLYRIMEDNKIANTIHNKLSIIDASLSFLLLSLKCD